MRDFDSGEKGYTYGAASPAFIYIVAETHVSLER